MSHEREDLIILTVVESCSNSMVQFAFAREFYGACKWFWEVPPQLLRFSNHWTSFSLMMSFVLLSGWGSGKGPRHRMRPDLIARSQDWIIFRELCQLFLGPWSFHLHDQKDFLCLSLFTWFPSVYHSWAQSDFGGWGNPSKISMWWWVGHRFGLLFSSRETYHEVFLWSIMQG